MYERRLNKDVKEFPDELKGLVEKRLRKLATLDKDIDSVKTDTIDPAEACRLVDGDFCDPVRLINKNEPTVPGKPTRNVSSVSLIDSIVDVILDIMQLQEEVRLVSDGYEKGQHWPHPSTIGIDLQTPDNLAFLWRRFALRARLAMERLRFHLYGDVSGWEYQFSVACHRMYQAWWVCLLNRVGGAPAWWLRLKKARNWCLMHPLLVSSSGQMYSLSIAIMLSGSRRTAHANSVVRAAVPSVVSYPLLKSLPPQERVLDADANGDDCAEESVYAKPHALIDAYAALGFKLTDVEYTADTEEVHFCSWIFRERKMQPESYGKALMKLLAKKQVLDNVEYFQFHDRYVVTGLVSFVKLFPFVRTLLASDCLSVLLATGRISAVEHAECIALCSSPAEWKTNGNHADAEQAQEVEGQGGSDGSGESRGQSC